MRRGPVGTAKPNARNRSVAKSAVETAPAHVAASPSGLTPPERPRCNGSRVRMSTGGFLLCTPTSDAQVSEVLAASAPADTTSSHPSPEAAYASAQRRAGALFASTWRSLRGPLCRCACRMCGSSSSARARAVRTRRAIALDARFELPKNHMSRSHKGHPPTPNSSAPTTAAPSAPGFVSSRNLSDARATAPESASPAATGARCEPGENSAT